MIKTWSVRSEIVKRVNDEAEYNWGKTRNPELPKYEKKQKQKWSITSLTAFARELLP